jgi:magnesium-transporting ATPase (P-type)
MCRCIQSEVPLPAYGCKVIEEFCDWLSATPVSVAFQSANWFVPLVQTIHIIAIAILLTAVYVISFRLVGLTRGTQSLPTMMARSTPWIWIALAVLLVTGLLLTITEPARELLNWVFRIKMLLVLTLAAILWWLQARMRADPAQWSQTPRLQARVVGIVCVLIGAAIITAGRWIAYV